MEEKTEQQQNWWQKHKKLLMRTVLIALLVVVIVLIILNILGYIFNWDWTGLGPYVSPPHSSDSDFQRGKTLWDWLQLLIIPAVIAVAGYIINLTISRGEQAATEQRAKSEREAVEKRADTEREIALDNQRETALQAYIDKMSELLIDQKLTSGPPNPGARISARVRTLTVLPRLDAYRKRRVLRFLYESNLINKGTAIIDLGGADLRGADLNEAYLYKADLSIADLRWADLREADLREVNLRGVKMNNKTELSGTKLLGAEYNTKNTRPVSRQEKLDTIGPTQWPQRFDPKANGAMCIDC
jgi:flagellar basal body-associated protein FliL